MNIEQLEIEVHKLSPENGDVLVLKCRRQLSMEVCKHIASMFRDLQHRINKRIEFIILDDGMELEVLKTSRLADLRSSDDTP